MTRCPEVIYYLRKVYGLPSKFTAWEIDGVFMGLIEILPGRLPVFHRLCPICSGHFDAIGSCSHIEQPSRSAPVN